jgi:hypothetical protein
MTEKAVVTADSGAAVLEQVIIKGDLAKLTETERVAYYNAVCQSLGLNPLTRPFDYIVLNGRLQLYARRDATDQLRNLHRVSITSLEPKQVGDLVVVVASGRTANGREDTATGVVNVKGLMGENLANAMMKAETKAKRRLTLSLVGLGFLTEDEVADIQADVDRQAPPVHPRSLVDHVRARRAAVTPPVDEDPEITQASGVRRLEEAAATPTADLVEGLDDELVCGDEDASPMALGLCDLPPDHKGPHRSEHGTWPR